MLRLPPRSPDHPPIASEGSLVAVTRPWQLLPPQDALCLIIKSTWAITAEGALTPLAEQPPPSGEELAPFKPRADVLLVGHAYPGSGSRGVAHVQLGLGAMRRTLAAIGPRTWSGGAPTAPKPFDKIPLRWERAFGGPGYHDNPVGVGIDGGLPSLEQADALIESPSDRPAPACFAAIPAVWRARRGKLGSYDDDWRALRWPYFPRDFDWSYFNAAPEAQQLPYLRGDERFDLAGVHPTVPVISGKLPGMLPHAFALVRHGAQERWRGIKLNLDTVDFDADALTVSLVWRGLMEVSAEHAPEVAHLWIASDVLDAPSDPDDHRRRFVARMLAQHGPDVVGPREAKEAHEHKRAPRAPVMSRELALAVLGSEASLAGVTLAGCDLGDADLRGRDLSGLDLRDAWLHGARLDGATLRGAVLVGVRAERCSFDGACLDDANLSEAILTDASFKGASLKAASLADASAAKACFDEACLDAVKLCDAELDGASFARAEATDADFSGALLERASFAGATLHHARLYRVRAARSVFDGASMEGARADDAILSHASFVGVKAAGIVMQGTDLRSSRWNEADLSRATFSHALLDGSTLHRVLARGARFRRARLVEASAIKADFMEANFEGADLSACDLRGASLYGAELWKAVLGGANLEGAMTKGTKLSP